MILSRAKYRQALIDGIKANIPDLKAVKVMEHEISMEKISQLILIAPFCLIMTSDLSPVETERLSGMTVGVAMQDFSLVFGARSLLSDKEKGIAGAEELLDNFRLFIDGRTFLIDGERSKPFEWLGDHFEFSAGGLFGFSAGCRVYQN